jgi:hypothetical protein
VARAEMDCVSVVDWELVAHAVAPRVVAKPELLGEKDRRAEAERVTALEKVRVAERLRVSEPVRVAERLRVTETVWDAERLRVSEPVRLLEKREVEVSSAWTPKKLGSNRKMYANSTKVGMPCAEW